MEGFLLKKGRQESALGRRNWKKRWFVLDGTFLEYFEDFDTKSGAPVDKKGMVSVLGYEAKPYAHHEKQYTFQMLHPTKNTIYLQAPDEKMMEIWINTINEASRGKFGPSSVNFDDYYRVLGLDPAEEPSSSQISKAYRKAALKVHPDKGGDMLEFRRVQEAFDVLMSKLEEEEFEKLVEYIQFSVSIRKGPPGVGFGMVVVEDTKRGVVKVKTVLPTMDIVSIDDVSRGQLQPEDLLLSIGDDDVRSWTLNRVIQRLSDFRVQVGSIVNMTFARRVMKDGSTAPFDYVPAMTSSALRISEQVDRDAGSRQDPALQEEMEEYIQFDVRIRKGPPGVGFGMVAVEDTERGVVKVKTASPTMDIVSIDDVSRGQLQPEDLLLSIGDDDVRSWTLEQVIQRLSDSRVQVGSIVHMTFARPVPRTAGQADRNDGHQQRRSIGETSDFSDSALIEEEDYDDEDHEDNQNAQEAISAARKPNSGQRSFGSDNAARASLLAENEDLQNEVQILRAKLLRFQEEKDMLAERVEDLTDERENLMSQNSKLNETVKALQRREEYVELQLQQAMLYSDVSGEQMLQSMRDMIAVSSLVQSGQTIEISEGIDGYLKGLGLNNTANQSIEDAQRVAITAVAAVDASGRLLRKWALSGDSCVEKLKRFEARLKRLEDSEISGTD